MEKTYEKHIHKPKFDKELANRFPVYLGKSSLVLTENLYFTEDFQYGKFILF